jgi:hypothetical protein
MLSFRLSLLAHWRKTMGDDTNKSNRHSFPVNRDEFIRNLLERTESFPKDDDSFTILDRVVESVLEFKTQFRSGTSSIESFLSISDIEEFILRLNARMQEVCFELLSNEIKNIPEKPHIDLKKKEYLDKGIRLRIYRSFTKTIMTIVGGLTYSRYALTPASATDLDRLKIMKNGAKMVFPLDEALGLDVLPYKMTVRTMLEIAYWATETCSFDAAQRAIERNTQIRVNAETIRAVVNTVGGVVFNNDVLKAERVYGDLQCGQLQFPEAKINNRGREGSPLPSLRTVLAVLPHTALRLVRSTVRLPRLC